MSYRFTGDYALIYPAYRDTATDRTLTAVPDPDLVYDMEPAGGQDLPVPPSDGRWELVPADPPPPPPPPAPAVATTISAQDEGTTTNA